MTDPNERITRWYREPWAWYILIILLVSISWGSFQVYTAFTIRDSVVIDDYYKNGKSINQDMTRIQNARTLGIEGILLIDALLGEVRVTLQGELTQWPQHLKLSFLSPVFADQDQSLVLTRSFGTSTAQSTYVGQLTTAVSGRYYLQLETQDELIPEVGYETGWKITQEAKVAPDTPIRLKNPEA